NFKLSLCRWPVVPEEASKRAAEHRIKLVVLEFFKFSICTFQFSVFNAFLPTQHLISSRNHYAKLRPALASQTCRPPCVQFLPARTRTVPKSQSAFLKSSQSVAAKGSATRVRANATDSILQFVRSAKTKRDRSTESANRLPGSTPPRSTT